MKKTFSIALLIITALTLVGCKSENSNLLEFNNKESVMAFQLSSSVDVIEQETPETTTTNEETVEVVTEEQVEAVEEISPYVVMFENMLASKNGFSHETKPSDLEGYTHMQVVTIPDFEGQSNTYVMYYNITSNLEDDNDDMDDDHDEDDDDDDKHVSINDMEEEFTFEGIIQYKDQTYTVYGKQELESNEMELEFTTKIDENNYVVVKYEVESEEIEFQYEVYRDGSKISEFKVEFETEDDETKIELEYASDNQFGKYEFELEEKDGKLVLKVEFETELDGVFTKGKAYYNVTYDENNQAHYEIIFTKQSDDSLED